MTRDDVLRLLAEHRAELRRRGVKSIALFGSAARGEAGPQSDVDILVEFETPPTFDRYMDVKFYLEDLLGAPVDLVTLRSLKPLIRPAVEHEAVYINVYSLNGVAR
ncbi:MAG: nucleotidyltransferase family protein [Anaerolineae bacterium]|nr:nucleotidyltransferase family protein [Anaerolineae bacterium]